jgi:hypothetical protein
VAGVDRSSRLRNSGTSSAINSTILFPVFVVKPALLRSTIIVHRCGIGASSSRNSNDCRVVLGSPQWDQTSGISPDDILTIGGRRTFAGSVNDPVGSDPHRRYAQGS